MLTDTQCRTAKPKEKLYRLNDFNGLYLEVKPNGKKAWRYRFKLNGKSSMFALGEYPAVKLAEARDKCEQARKQVAEGINPAQARQLDKIRKVNDACNTFELIAKEWLQMKDWADITKTRRLDILERVVFPAIGKLPIREITPHHFIGFRASGSDPQSGQRSCLACSQGDSGKQNAAQTGIKSAANREAIKLL